MTLLAAVRQILVTDTAVSGLLGSTTIGGTAVKSVYPIVLPDTQIGYPAIRLTRISEPKDPVNGARKTRVQIDCYATTYGVAQKLAEAVCNALTTTEWVDDNITILNTSAVNSRDSYDANTRLYQAIEEISFVWRYTP